VSTSYGGQEEQNTTGNPDMPDLEFLEFLGQFETDEGEWIDPGSLMAEEFSDLLNAAVVIESNSSNDGSTGNNGNDQQSN
jgi:hypothetical protein